MNIQENISLKDKCTMKVGGIAKHFTAVTSENELIEAVEWAKSENVRWHILGGGSNTIFTDEGFDGLVIEVKLLGIDIKQMSEKEAWLVGGAGVVWDDAVALAVQSGLSGIEALSLIPGTLGAAPVQNIGAYGQELADAFVELRALNTQTMQVETLSRDDLLFAYRDSLLKHRDNYAVTQVTLRLNKTWLKPPFYKALEQHLESEGITTYDPATIREAVITIRTSKLPDPSTIPNAGSFFVNPIVDNQLVEKLTQQYPNMPSFPLNDARSKIPAGWLIEQAGFKGKCHHSGNICAHKKHALVITNTGDGTYAELAEFTKEIAETVQGMFGIDLIQEPQTIL